MKFNNRNDMLCPITFYSDILDKYITKISRMIQPTEDGVKGNSHLF